MNQGSAFAGDCSFSVQRVAAALQFNFELVSLVLAINLTRCIQGNKRASFATATSLGASIYGYFCKRPELLVSDTDKGCQTHIHQGQQ